MSLKTKLILSLSTVLFLGFSVTHIFNYQISRDALHTNIVTESLPMISNNIYSEIQKDLMGPINISSLMANDTFVKDWLLNGEQEIEKIQKYLWEIKERYGFVSTFLISTKTMNYYHFKGIHKQIHRDDPHDDWYFNFLNQNEKYDLDVDTDEAANNNLTIFINHRLYDYDNQLLGVTGAGLSMNQIGQLLTEYQGLFKRNIYMIDRQGLVQVHTDLDQILKTNITEQEGIQDVAQEILSTKKDSATFEFNRNGTHILLIARYIPEFDWYLLVEQDETLTLADIRKNLIRNLLIGVLITGFVLIINIITVNYFQSELELMATTDPLTGTCNRKIFFEKARMEFSRCRRYEIPMAVMMLDLDHFKKVNDNYGHFTGDEVLKSFVKECNRILRASDLLGRLGGEEFAVLLVETQMGKAQTVAERIKTGIAEQPILVSEQPISITVSIGLTQISPSDIRFEQIVQRADEALYQAKTRGRNRVEIL